jgi:hypothetical protein
LAALVAAIVSTFVHMLVVERFGEGALGGLHDLYNLPVVLFVSLVSVAIVRGAKRANRSNGAA